MSWVLFAILAALSWAIVNTFDKYVLSKYVKKPIVPVIFVAILGIIASFLVFSFKGFGQLSNLNIILA